MVSTNFALSLLAALATVRNTVLHTALVSCCTCHQAVLRHLQFPSGTHQSRWPEDRNLIYRYERSLRSQPVFGVPWKACSTEDRAPLATWRNPLGPSYRSRLSLPRICARRP